MHAFSHYSRRLLCATCVVALLVGGGSAAATGSRGHHAAAAAPQPVTYHLTLLLSGAAPTIVEGQLGGTLDAQGALTATLTTSGAVTTTVTGMLPASAGATLTMRWGGAPMTLVGRVAASGTGGGAIITAAGSLGAWVLVPELVSHTYTFDARIATGRYRGQDLGGKLVIALEQGGSGRFDGTLTEDDGTVLAVTGALVYGNMQLAIAGPGRGRLLGDAAITPSRSILGDSYNLYKGSFAGPGTGDRGTWTAAQEG